MTKRPTAKQNEARARNWRIRSLRALWAQAGLLSDYRATRVRFQIDEELASLGAEREQVRRVIGRIAD